MSYNPSHSNGMQWYVRGSIEVKIECEGSPTGFNILCESPAKS